MVSFDGFNLMLECWEMVFGGSLAKRWKLFRDTGWITWHSGVFCQQDKALEQNDLYKAKDKI